MRFGEIERPTTNQIPSLLQSLPEDFPVRPQNMRVTSFSHSRRWLRFKPEYFRFIAEQGQYRSGQQGRGLAGTQKSLTKSLKREAEGHQVIENE
ncbi:hypothetical protein H009_25475 [Agrobacterium tumefaciens str. Cherry 2E-2-2]|nr:hypothetical protein H009_25475 [Agrobacterium tumefaciens str. Cherry 2E-2-2]